MPESHDSAPTRRALMATGIGIVGAGYAGAIAYPVYRYLATPVRRAEAAGQTTEVAIPQGDLPQPGSALMYSFGTKPALLIHHADGALASFDAVCTHLGCTVQFEPQNQRIFCACHGGVYDMRTGAVVAGPPPKGLAVHRVEVHDGNVVISRA